MDEKELIIMLNLIKEHRPHTYDSFINEIKNLAKTISTEHPPKPPVNP